MDRHQHPQPNMPSSSRSAPQRARNASQLAGHQLVLAVSSWAAGRQLGLGRPSQQPLLTTAPSCPLALSGINMASVLHWGMLTGSLVAFPGAGLLSTAPRWEAGQDAFCDHTCTVSWMRCLSREPGAHWACHLRPKQ